MKAGRFPSITFVTLSVAFCWAMPGFASEPLITKMHQVGLLGLRVTDSGFFGGSSTDGRNARWQGYEHLGLSGIWVGAIGPDQTPYVSAADAFAFAPLPLPGETIRESYEGQVGGFRIGLLGIDPADDDEDGLIDEDFQNGLDDDGDGLFDEDFQAIGQQMFSTTYTDASAQYPLGLLVRQRSFQWSTGDLNELVGFDFEVINDGDTDLYGVHLGIYCDANIGPASTAGYAADDLAGWDRIDTTLFNPGPGDQCYTSMYVGVQTLFMWDALDDGITATGGDAPGVFGTILVGHTTDVTGIRALQRVDWTTATWITRPDGMPATNAERYQLLSGGNKPTDNPRSGVARGSTSLPGDYATLLSVGPFPTLHPGESITFQAAHVVGQGFPGFRKNAARAQKMAAALYLDLDNDFLTGLAGKERCLKALEGGEPVIWDSPCDTINPPIEWSSTECMWVDLDCNPCTGIYGAETLIPWVGSVAPPYPGTNLDPAYRAGLPPGQTLVVSPAGNGLVILQWDNLGETWQDPITGEKNFYGYRIWKVSDWIGPSVPDPDDWQQIAEFTVDPGANNYLGTIVNRDVDPIGTTEDGTPIFPVGRYAFVDSTVTNGVGYFYAISSFSRLTTGQGTIEIAALPWTLEDRLVVPCDLCNPVPVRLLSFTAKRIGNTAHLSWTISDSQDLTGFHVAREVMGVPGRSRISERLISGNEANFTFVDQHPPSQAVDYWLEEVNRDGTRVWLGPATVDAAMGVAVFSVRSPVPNPFTTVTYLAYGLPDTRRVRASIYDLTGRRIRVLMDEEQGAGTFNLLWNGQTEAGVPAAPGMYILSLEAGKDRVSREILLLR